MVHRNAGKLCVLLSVISCCCFVAVILLVISGRVFVSLVTSNGRVKIIMIVSIYDSIVVN